MSTYIELQEQIKTLQAQAEALRTEELPSVIADIKSKVAQYGITADQIFDQSNLSSSTESREPGSRKDKLPMKYKCGDLEWSGRGKMPKPFEKAIEDAKKKGQIIDKEYFLINKD